MIRIDPEGYKHTGRTRDDLEVVLLESAALLQVGTVWILLDHIEPGFPELLAACLTKKPDKSVDISAHEIAVHPSDLHVEVAA